MRFIIGIAGWLLLPFLLGAMLVLCLLSPLLLLVTALLPAAEESE